MIRITREGFQTYRYLKANRQRWVTVDDVANAGGFVGRTARKHLADLTSAGVVDRIEVFPAFRYRLADPPPPRASDLVGRLEQAAEVYGAPRPGGA